MTRLEDKTKRDNYGIDTFERGFIYAALLLRASNTDPNNSRLPNKNPYYNAVRLAFNFEVNTDQEKDESSKSYTTAAVLVQAKLPYNSILALKHGGYFLNYLGEYGNNDPNPFAINAPETDALYYTMYNEPEWVNTLEKYLAWCATNLVCGFEAQIDLEKKPVKIQILEEGVGGASIQIDAELEFDYHKFLQTNNLFYAIKQLIQTGCKFTYIPDNGTVYNANIGNSNAMSNDGLLGN